MAWYKTMVARLQSLGYTQSKFDNGIFHKYDGTRLVAVLCLHVDDIMIAGEPAAIEDFRANLGFKIGSWKSSEFDYCGVHYRQSADFAVHYDMKAYELLTDEVQTTGKYKNDEDLMSEADVSRCRSAIGNL
jgi:hypothetical protein